MIQKYDVVRLRSRVGLSQEKFAEKTRSIRFGRWKMGDRPAQAPWSIPSCLRASKKTAEKENE